MKRMDGFASVPAQNDIVPRLGDAIRWKLKLKKQRLRNQGPAKGLEGSIAA